MKEKVEIESLDVIEEVKEEITPKEKTKHAICDIKFVHDDYVYFIFEQDTLRELFPTITKERVSVDVEYVGTYGKADFKVIGVK